MLLAQDAFAQRVALIIANSKYRNLSALSNPKNDAPAIAKLLTKVGFAESDITVKYDVGYDEMRLAIRDFKRRAVGAEAAVLYFAGHGLGGGENFLVPVDAELKSWLELRDETISQRALEDAVSPASGIKLVILDACRNDPSLGQMSGIPKTRSVDRGLGRVEPDGGILVAYSAKHGTVAQDGPPGGNSPFALALIKHLAAPEDIRLAFGGVRDEVMQSTSNQQEPFLYGSLGQKRLVLAPETVTPTTQQPLTLIPSSPVVNPSLTPSFGEAAQAWAIIQNTNSQAVLEDFVQRFGDGVYGGFARARLAEIRRESATQETNRGETAKQGVEQSKNQPACDKSENVEVCLTQLGWVKTATQGEFDLMFTHSQKYYFGLIDEPYGSVSGVQYETLQSAILSNAAKAAAIDPKNVPLLNANITLKDRNLRSIAYGPKLQGTPFIFYNAYQILPNSSVQLVFWGIGKEFPPELTKLIESSLEKIKFQTGLGDQAKQETACDRSEKVEVCLAKLGWVKTVTQGEFDLMFTHSQKYYFGIIDEPYGSTHGVQYETLKAAIISNAAKAAAIEPKNVPLLKTRIATKNNPGLRAIAYGPKLQGTPFIFYNAYQIMPSNSVQLIFWGIGKEIAPDFSNLIGESLEEVKFE
ncbi:MAG: caspase family protein [Chitinophagales bacterium]|nr:caspase family protein [Hyphomicrobiales bacterium]